MTRFLLFAVAAPLLAQQLTLVSGNGQLMLEQFPSTQPMVVRAVDASGRPAAGVPVTWAITRGQGTIRDPEAQTDSEGLARARFQATSIQPGSSYLQTVVTASAPSGSIEFFMTTTQSIGLGTAQPIIQVYGPAIVRGPAGSTVPEAFIVVVAASAGALLGQGIPNVGIRVIPSETSDANSATGICEGPGGVILTNAQGRATCNMRLGAQAGTSSFVIRIGEISNSREMGLEVTAGQACNLTVTPATLNFGASGGTATFNVSGVNCAWTATTAASWLSIQGNASGSGTGQVTVNVTPNSGAARSTVIAVGSATVNVVQTATGTAVPLAFAVGGNLPQATAGFAYSSTLSVNGGQPPYTWSATAPLPPGLSLNTSTGIISGTVSNAGSYSIPVTVRDAAGTTINQTFSLVVSTGQNPGGGLTFTTTSLPAGLVNTQYSQEIRVAGGCANPFSGGARVQIVSGGLPQGLTSQSAPSGSGLLITGIPAVAGTFQLGLRASDSCGAFVTREYTLSISAVPAVFPMTSSSIGLTFTLQRGTGRTPPEQTVTISTGTSTVPFTATVTSDGGWLAISPDRGTTSTDITARVVNTDLQPGTYSGSITITSDAPNSPLRIPATLTVTSVGAATVTPTNVAFDYEPGGILPAAQTISVSTTGAVVPFTSYASTASGSGWLSVVQTGATTPAFVSVSVNPAGLSPGTYTGSVIITPAFNLQPIAIPVTLNVGRTAPALTSVTNGASFQQGAIAPGQIVTLFGTNIGPAALATFRLNAAGMIDTQLSDVRVYFDDIPAPVIYASGTQTTVVVPYGIGGRASTRLQVEYRGIRSTSIDVPVALSAPGLFTIGGSLQGAILNQDNTVNGTQNGAQPGTIVSLYATGEGATIPGGLEGSIVPPTALARPVLPVSVTIGGRPAEVLYAGSAPGLAAGVMQVNVRIPPETPAGSPAPVVLTVGSVSSQAGVTLFVRP